VLAEEPRHHPADDEQSPDYVKKSPSTPWKLLK